MCGESARSAALPTLAIRDVKKLSESQEVSITLMEKNSDPLKKEPSLSWLYDKDPILLYV